MPDHLHHVTLSTGHTRRSPRSEVASDVMPLVADLLQRALRGERRVVVPGQPAFWLYVSAEADALTVSVLTGETPVATFGVARSEHGSLQLWGRLRRDGDRALDRPPPAPWCGVVLLPPLAQHPEAAQWLGDMERCLAWAWVEAGE